MHRKNRSTLRETIRLLGSLGVQSVKCGRMMELGEWTSPEVRGLQMTRQEELEMFEEYIPQYFEDDAPVGIMMADTLMYTPGPQPQVPGMPVRGPLHGWLPQQRADAGRRLLRY